jgi:type VI secretion system secreted protein Hcp
MAAVDYFLKIEGVKGESGDSKHKEEIDVESWSWGETQAGTAGHGSGSGAGKVKVQDFNFVKKVDKASPVLFLACANGTHYKSAILTARKAGKEQQEYLTITMSDILITSFQVGGSGHSDVVPTDQISINFAKLEFQYKEQKSDGTLGAAVKHGYDFFKNVVV